MTDTTKLFDLTDRVAVVTGASSGLGVAFAEGLAGAGAKIVIAARRRDRLDEVAKKLRDDGADVHVVTCDVAKDDDVVALAKSTLDHYGKVDVLVNNAGVANVAPALEEPLDQFRKVVDVNLVGTMSCTQAFGRPMLAAGKGSIINIASVLGLVGAGLIPQASYVASKGGVVNMTRDIAAQWARLGVRVNAIAPGWFPSEMTTDMFSGDDGKRFIRKRTPMGRAGDPKELVGPLLLLASDASSFMTGQTIAVDGGWTIV